MNIRYAIFFLLQNKELFYLGKEDSERLQAGEEEEVTVFGRKE